MNKFRGVAFGAAALVAACDPTPTGDKIGAGTPVVPTAETVAVGTVGADAADDPAIWVDRADPSRALIFGTDKKAGLDVYGLDGTLVQRLEGGRPNNVDLREGFMAQGRSQVLIAASDRSPERFGVALYLMDPATFETNFWGVIRLDLTEPYGLCLGKRSNDFIAIVNGTDGQVRQLVVSVGPDGAPTGVEEQRYALPSQVEGCVVDDRAGVVYIGEEAAGVWRYPLDPSRNEEGRRIAAAPSEVLVPDVEGLTLMRRGSGTWLLASSQGDSAVAVWRVDAEPLYQGRFSVVASGGIDAVTRTDGIAAIEGPVGPFTTGLVVVQDDLDEAPGRGGKRQNFKLVDWSAISEALRLE